MSKYFVLCVIFLFSIDLSFSKEKIINFDVEITPDKEGFLVTEKIEYDFPKRKHGIYRDIITREKRTLNILGKKINPNYFIELNVKNVTDEYGRRRVYKKKAIHNGIRVKIGQKGHLIQGRHHYHITYYVKRALRFFDRHDEIYWNVTGNHWRVNIENVTIKLNVPYGSQVKENAVKVFRGHIKSNRQVPFDISDNSVRSVAQNIRPGQGLTIAIPFYKGFFKEYSIFQKAWWIFKSNMIWSLTFLLPLFTFLTLFFIHRFKGKELYKVRTTPVQYDPPMGLSPAEVGTLMDDEVHTSDIVSIIYDLAARGFLSIEEQAMTGFKFFSDAEYKITILIENHTGLLPFERAVLTRLQMYSKSVSGQRVLYMSELNNKFYQAIEGIKDKIYRQMAEHKFYFGRPDKIRNMYNSVATGIYILIYVGFPLVGRVEGAIDLIFLLPSIFVCYLIIKFFAKIMPKKSKRGLEVYRHVMGYKEFIERVEKKKLKLMVKEDPTLFERTLPYAVAMGLAEEWAEKFEGIAIQKPSWYQTYSRDFDSKIFMRSIGESMSSISSSISSAPRSSGSSGSFGGGGFSGGGSGGGGGGSW